MAVLKAIEYATNSDFIGSWFNDTESAKTLFPESYFDIFEWSELISSRDQESLKHNDKNGDKFVSPEEAKSLWKLTKNSITFKSRSVINSYVNDNLVNVEDRINTAIWKGNFEIKGDRITGGYVSAFERDWGNQGIIEITDFEYPIKKEAAAFAVLTLPEKITGKIEENLDFLKEGETYTFSTAYDTKSTADTQIINEDSRKNTLNRPNTFNKKSVDKITNFNPSTDTIEIDTDSFDIDSSATFAAGKNKKFVKKKLAKQDFDFLYDEKKGGLYFNENGAEKGFGDGGIIAILKGAPDLTSGNLEFI